MADWSERELEDWLCDNAAEFFGGDYEHIARQVTLPNGKIIDMLGWNPVKQRPVIVELKAVMADGEALTQLLSYMHALDAVMDGPFATVLDLNNPDCGIERLIAARTVSRSLRCQGILVAPCFSDRVVVAADWFGQDLYIVTAEMRWKATGTCVNWREEFDRPVAPALSDCAERVVGVALKQPCQCRKKYWHGNSWTYVSGDGGFDQGVGDNCIICGLLVPKPSEEEYEEYLSGLCSGTISLPGEDEANA